MKYIILSLLLLLSLSSNSQYRLLFYQVRTKGAWDLQYKTDSVVNGKNTPVVFLLSTISIGSNFYTLNESTKDVIDDNSTTWRATDKDGTECKIVIKDKIISVIYNDNGYYKLYNYYLK